MRKRMKGRKDNIIFSKTARRTRKINVSPTIPRGGIRL